MRNTSAVSFFTTLLSWEGEGRAVGREAGRGEWEARAFVTELEAGIAIPDAADKHLHETFHVLV